MTTSANVTEYRITKDGKQVGSHSQSHLCKTHWEDLLKFSPPEEFQIQPWGYDEDEEEWEQDEQNLFEFLLKCSPCPFPKIPRRLVGILGKDAETGSWAMLGGFLDEDPEILRKVAHTNFGPGNFKIISTMVRVMMIKKDQEVPNG